MKPAILFDIDVFLQGVEVDDSEPNELEQMGKDSAARGHISELVFEIVCHTEGWEAAKCIQPNAPYDYVIRLDDEWKTVQVKSVGTRSWLQNGKRMYQDRVVRLWRGGKSKVRKERRYTDGDFDFLFATTGSEHWLIPYEAIDTEWIIDVDQRRYRQFKVAMGEGASKS